MSTQVKLDAAVQAVLANAVCQPLLVDQTLAAASSMEQLERDSWSGLHLPDNCQAASPQVDGAVAAARSEYERGAWRARAKRERRGVLLEWAHRIEADALRLAYLNCLETGRSLRSLLEDSVPKAVQVLRWFAELIDKLDDRAVHSGEFGADFALLRREPIGVVAAILPWNDPLVTLVWKVAPALAMGNSIIVKPSEYATLVVREAIGLAHQAGVPSGCLQMLTGDGQAGRLLVCHSGVDKVAFTGSTRTAVDIGRDAHLTGLKRLSFECGGKGSFIFGEGGRAPKEFARVVAQNMFYNQGQICSAPSVVHIPENRADALIADICKAALPFFPAHPLAEARVGLMVSRAKVAAVRQRLGAVELAYFASVQGAGPSGEDLQEWSLKPTVLRDLPADHPFWDEELFAPVLLVRTYRTVSDAVRFANASRYGLAAGVWSQDIDECITLADQLQAGNVHINSWGDDPNQVPFGGIKASGHGREKSIDSLEGYSQLKSIFFKPAGRN